MLGYLVRPVDPFVRCPLSHLFCQEMGPLVRQCGVRDHVTVPGSLKTSDGGAGDSPKGRSSKPISGTASISVSTDHFLQSQRVLMYLICTPDQWLAGLLEMQY